MTENKGNHVVIVGAGFAGLLAAKTLAGTSARVTVIDKNNYHTFLPLLYQVGAAEIAPEQIAHPVRAVLRRHSNIDFRRERVDEIRSEEKVVICGDERIAYDYLIIACGAATEHFGTPGAPSAFALGSLDEAMVLRNHILVCFERAAVTKDPALRRRLLSFVIVGGGPTGVEYAGALAELTGGPLRKDFPSISRDEISIRLVEASQRLLSSFSDKAGDFARRRLGKMGVEVVLGQAVGKIDPAGVTLAGGERIEAGTVIWSAGVRGAYLKSDLGQAALANGRIEVDRQLRVPGREDVHVAGDLAHFEHDGACLPMIAPVAIQQGKHAAKNILRAIQSRQPLPFEYKDKGLMATIGRSAAVTKLGAFETRGFLAWLMWLFIHIVYLIGFRNRIIVLINWFWSYVFFDRAVRLIMPGCCERPLQQSCARRAEAPGEAHSETRLHSIDP